MVDKKIMEYLSERIDTWIKDNFSTTTDKVPQDILEELSREYISDESGKWKLSTGFYGICTEAYFLIQMQKGIHPDDVRINLDEMNEYSIHVAVNVTMEILKRKGWVTRNPDRLFEEGVEDFRKKGAKIEEGNVEKIRKMLWKNKYNIKH